MRLYLEVIALDFYGLLAAMTESSRPVDFFPQVLHLLLQAGHILSMHVPGTLGCLSILFFLNLGSFFLRQLDPFLFFTLLDRALRLILVDVPCL
jgi:hypothetical protein